MFCLICPFTYARMYRRVFPPVNGETVLLELHQLRTVTVQVPASRDRRNLENFDT